MTERSDAMSRKPCAEQCCERKGEGVRREAFDHVSRLHTTTGSKDNEICEPASPVSRHCPVTTGITDTKQDYFASSGSKGMVIQIICRLGSQEAKSMWFGGVSGQRLRVLDRQIVQPYHVLSEPSLLASLSTSGWRTGLTPYVYLCRAYSVFHESGMPHVHTPRSHKTRSRQDTWFQGQDAYLQYAHGPTSTPGSDLYCRKPGFA